MLPRERRAGCPERVSSQSRRPESRGLGGCAPASGNCDPRRPADGDRTSRGHDLPLRDTERDRPAVADLVRHRHRDAHAARCAASRSEPRQSLRRRADRTGSLAVDRGPPGTRIHRVGAEQYGAGRRGAYWSRHDARRVTSGQRGIDARPSLCLKIDDDAAPDLPLHDLLSYFRHVVQRNYLDHAVQQVGGKNR